MLALAGVAV